ncbi:sensor histidine kinase, partial [Arthrobacter sp. SO3]|uniref:histidine kinase dimerization/phospho-acceptor domain-containing protein n=1 Tax=Arthrobacter sp. SO3 TaxID=1897057 RepID=UPI001CFFECDA
MRPFARTDSTRTDSKGAVARLAVQFAALMVVLLALMGGLMYSVVAAGADEADNRKLVGATQIDSTRDAPLDVFVAISGNGQLTVSRNMPAGLPDVAAIARVGESRGSERGKVQIAGRSYVVLTAFHDGRVVQAAVDQRERQEEADRLILALVIAGGAAAVLASAASVWMARRAMRPLVASMALQRRFIADASHELRTPLTLLSTRAQLLRRRLLRSGAAPAPQEVAKGVQGIVDDSKLLTGILDDLLMAADPRGAADYTPINLCAIGAGAAALAGGQAESQSLRLETDFPAGPVVVRGSAVSLGRVFTALISNALDHARTTVHVTVSTRGRDAVIRVADDG